VATLLGRRPVERGFDFRGTLREKQLAVETADQDAPTDFLDWNEQIPVPQVGPLDLEAFPYAREWYGEEVIRAEEVAWMKSSQVGLTEYAWRWGMHRSDRHADTCIYVFPSKDYVTEFGDTRVEPAIEESPYLRSRIKPHWVKHKTLKRIGAGWLVFRGTKSKAGAQSTAAQAVIFDEYDLLEPDNRAQMERRIRGARQLGKRPRIRRFGNPTIPGDGIDSVYQSSDRRRWLVTCEECDEVQPVTWEDNVRWRNVEDGPVLRAGTDEFVIGEEKVVHEAWRICRRCEERLDVRRGEWVPENSGAPVIGYHVTQLIVPVADLVAIVRSSRVTKPGDVEAFFNNDLGVPYSPSEAALKAEDIIAACQRGGVMHHGYAGASPTTMGIDVASERDLHARIDEQLPAEHPNVPNPRRALWMGPVKDFHQLADLIAAFNVHLVAIDSMPERRSARALQATFPGRVVLVEYDDDDRAEPIKVSEMTDEHHPLLPPGIPLKVRVNRTEGMDAMMDSIRQQRNWPLADPPPNYQAHLLAPKRRTKEKPSGRKVRVYVSTGADDYAHAEVYCLVATELWRARVGVMQQRAAYDDRHLADETLGFKRLDLQGDVDSYDPGFSGGGG
jgi:hypothetical protein